MDDGEILGSVAETVRVYVAETLPAGLVRVRVKEKVPF